ncbi:thiamine phosphate synthase [Varunaivibrio sulfuroxidans]|uniref:Thiamine-phosphate pyrophosphorylase n=1 Tax=Varunaivibrio sulfuroxidans TaxID=1773489 RepID=A0A4R3JH66_9PROT|nr:thiamine phosphate synthase [Varunaivibrio sulfuroxidans]TCS64845.1 thiamine-phosphate pyrophosphorylase [Varunaivibrio sulfuroxidans]WES29854.1 thiamine phosphate synthase [Varunaivibrio sulfuroxidans]
MEGTLTDRGPFDNFSGRVQRARGAQAVPGLFLMTDSRLPDPLAVARGLPRGSAVVVRTPTAGQNRALFAALVPLARSGALRLLATLPLTPISRRTAHGVHLDEAWVKRHPHRRRLCLPKNFIVTVSAHDRAAVIRAIRFGADAIFASPLHASASHPNKKSLGFWRFHALFGGHKAQRSVETAKIIALGGVTAEDMARLRRQGVWAIAGIDLFRRP